MSSQSTPRCPAQQRPVSIYLASRYARREEMLTVATRLTDAGHAVTSRWLTAHYDPRTENALELPAALRRQFAAEDLEDVDRADCVVSFTEMPDNPHGRGGRHVEFGYALARGKRLIVVGHYENIFHCLDRVEFVGSTEELLALFGTTPLPDRVQYRPVPGFPGYTVGSDGTVWGKFGNKSGILPLVLDGVAWWPIKPSLNRSTNRYYFYPTNDGNKTKTGKGVHQAVLEAFTGPRDSRWEGRHLNGNPHDNRLSNLAWGTKEENQMDRVRHGTSNRGERQGSARLNADVVRMVRSEVASGTPVNTLAKRLDVSRSTINSIVSGRRWSWVE